MQQSTDHFENPAPHHSKSAVVAIGVFALTAPFCPMFLCREVIACCLAVHQGPNQKRFSIGAGFAPKCGKSVAVRSTILKQNVSLNWLTTGLAGRFRVSTQRESHNIEAMGHFRLILCLLTVLAACTSSEFVPVPPGTTLIILRHADREGEDLTAKGIARAEALVTALEGISIDAIYSPGIKRNLDTAAPLAAARGLTVNRLPAENPAASLMAAGAGKTIIWIGNKGNLRSIWDSLNAPEPPPLEYGDLFFVTKARIGSPLVERRRVEP